MTARASAGTAGTIGSWQEGAGPETAAEPAPAEARDEAAAPGWTNSSSRRHADSRLLDGDWPAPPSDDAYHGLAGEIVDVIASVSEADRVALLVTLLTGVGALSNGRSVFRGAWQAPNLFSVLVGGSSTSRKGTALAVVEAVIRSAVGEELDRITVPGLASGEGLIAHLRRSPPGERRALVTETEFSRLLAVMGREGSTLSMIVRDAFDGVKLGRFLAREELAVSDHHVALLGHTTPEELRARLTEVDLANGFANRMAFYVVRRSRVVPNPEDPVPLCAQYVEPLAQAIVFGTSRVNVLLTPRAEHRWAEFYEAHTTRRAHGLTGALTARGEVHVVRLALVYAVFARSELIDVEHLAAAIALWQFIERSTRHIFGDSTGNRHADALRRLLKEEGEIPRDRVRQVLGLRSAADVDQVISLLVDLGEAAVDRGQTTAQGGRPPQIVRKTHAT